MRRRRLIVTGSVFVLAAAATLTAVLGFRSRAGIQPGCEATVGSLPYALDLEQAANAATIAAVGHREGLPNHAVTVALAAALQESKLRNVAYGDRDSLGLFQQRPSQGWGAPTDLLKPTYAAAAFYRSLRKVSGWATLPVADAAQRVQRSASGAAYEQWEDEARALARALTGEVPAGLSCRFGKPARPSGRSLAAVAAAQLGPLTMPAAQRGTLSASRGWAVASWLVANAYDYGINAISYDGRLWTSRGGEWRVDAKGTGRAKRVVRIVQAKASSQ